MNSKKFRNLCDQKCGIWFILEKGLNRPCLIISHHLFLQYFFDLKTNPELTIKTSYNPPYPKRLVKQPG